MARTKEFDVDATLDRAVELFRAKGYSATSVQDLVDTLGINRASIYDTFGTKEQLFAQAVQSYVTHTCALRTQMTGAQASPRAALVSFISQTAELGLKDPARGGCLVANSCVELGELSPSTSQQVTDGLRGTYCFLFELAQSAAEQGELPHGITPELAAAQALSCAVSIPILIKAGVPAKTIRAVAQSFANYLTR
jgi:TetR/AcrR family transcriptional regulator, transcriptional repressor for nem operon